MRPCVVLSGCILSLAINLSSAFAAEPIAADQMAAAVESWRTGDLNGAQGQLTQIIEAGTRDARVFYYRALVSELLGFDSEQDFKSAAKLEAETASTRVVNRALENVQGATRAKIEIFRAEARARLKPDPKAEARKAMFRAGMEARQAGDSATALAEFDAVINDGGTDPRVFYLRGVVLAELGQTDNARLAFAKGLSHEKSVDDVRLVDLALADVQGEIRQLIEEQTTVDARTWIFGVEKAIQTAITNGAGESTIEQFSFVSNGSPFVIAFSSPLLAGMSGSIPDAPAQAPPVLNQIVKAVRGKIAGAAITMDFASNLDLQVVVNLTEPEAASEAQGPLDQGLEMAKQKVTLPQ